MRARNLRLVVVGAAFLVFAAAFVLFMLAIAPRSNNPAELMRTVGTVAGVMGGVAVAMIVFGLKGTRPAGAALNAPPAGGR